MYDSIKKI